MFGLSRTPGNSTLFLGSSLLTSDTWQSYAVPQGATMLEILAVGGGGAGGSGFTGAASSARGGGGGGGSGSITRLLIPTFCLPEVLYVLPGRGAVGIAGSPTRVAVAPQTGSQYSIVHANNGGLGGTGSATAGGTAGAAGSIATVAISGPYSSLGQWTAIAGQAGAAGGAQTGAGGAALQLTAPQFEALVVGLPWQRLGELQVIQRA